MAKAKVFVFAPADPTGETHKRLEGLGCELVLGKASWSSPMGNNEDEMVRMAEGADALMGTSIRSSPITRRIMEASKNLRIVAKFTIGVDDVEVDAATDLGILVTHAPAESNWGGVAEGTLSIMLALLKKIREKDRWVKAGNWRSNDLLGAYVGSRADGYKGITIGIVGLGRVGGRFADLMRPWRARLIGYDPYIPDSKFHEHGVEKVDWQTLLRESDVVSLHVVLTKETRHMIGEAELRQMKPSAVLVNTSRGAAVDERALVRALQEGTITAAGLDVFEAEPIFTESPLLQLGDKVLLSPHMVSGNTGAGLKPGLLWGTEAVIKALKGEAHDNVYNKEVIPRWLERFGGKSLLSGGQ
ncbi:MAG: NAD(P)-dependent oxidoreductase [Candidatus Binatia bacterium]